MAKATLLVTLSCPWGRRRSVDSASAAADHGCHSKGTVGCSARASPTSSSALAALFSQSTCVSL
eukprot:4774930-Amphidinium_carterae.2